MAVITSPVIKDTTGQQIVNALDDIATLMENNVIDDTSIASNKTWSSYKINADIASKIPSTATSSNKLVDNSAMQSAISSAVSSAYHAAGTKTVAELTSSLLVAANEGNVYNITDSGVTTADFVEGAGKPINIGDNVGICQPSSGTYKFDLLSGFVDTTNEVTQNDTRPVTSGGVFSVIGALSSLTTTVKTNIVNAINELVTAITGINNKIPITASSVNQLVTESDVDLGLSISDGKLCVKYEK